MAESSLNARFDARAWGSDDLGSTEYDRCRISRAVDGGVLITHAGLPDREWLTPSVCSTSGSRVSGSDQADRPVTTSSLRQEIPGLAQALGQFWDASHQSDCER